MLPRKPAKRAFSGLVGLPPDLPGDSVPIPAVEGPKSKAALRAQRWRERQKANNPQFAEQERLRKEGERADKDREEKIAAVLAEKEPMLTVVNEDGKTVRVISGGFGSRRIAEMDDKSEQSEEEDGRRVTPSGTAPTNYDADAKKSHAKEHENQFVRASFQRVRTPREVKAMKQFIFTNVERYNHKSELTICSHCKVELTPFPSEVPLMAFVHFHDAHPKLFETMRAKVQKASEKHACPEDHERMRIEHGRGELPVQCRHCSKIVWRPGDRRRQRSDKVKAELEPTSV